MEDLQIEEEESGSVTVETQLGQLSLPYDHFEFKKKNVLADRRERFFVFKLHLLSGSAAVASDTYKMTLEDDGRTLVLKTHMNDIARRFLQPSLFELSL